MTQLTEMNVPYMRKLLQLNKENQKAYLQISNEIKYNFSLSEKETDEVLLDILEHMIRAQRNGIDADEFFGYDRMQYAKDIIDNLPQKDTKTKFQFIGYLNLLALSVVFTLYGFFDLIFRNSDGSHILVSSGTMILAVILYLIFTLFSGIYQKHLMHKRPNLNIVISIFIFIIIYFGIEPLLTYVKLGPEFYIPYWVSFIIAVLCAVYSRKLYKASQYEGIDII